MKATHTNTPRSGSPRRLAAHRCALMALPAAALLYSGGAQSQSSGCQQFRDTLAARVDPSIRGFTLDIVPASAAMPAGAKIFGTCDGGAFKIVFRRGGSTRASPGAASATAAEPQATTPPVVQSERSAKPTPAPTPAPAPAARPEEATPAPTAATPAVEPAKLPATSTRESEAARVTEREAPASPPQAEPARADETQAAPTPAGPGFFANYWRWLLALGLLPLAAWAWAWHAHRSAYDEAGLPRGPKL